MYVLIRSRMQQMFDGGRYGRFIKRWLNVILRRALDVLAAAIGLLLLSPFFLFIAVFIKIDSPGPVFYWSPRVGKHGKLFKMLKFRTMFEKPESYEGPRVTGQGDTRITPIGHWLRDTKLNELPQLWNVFIGDMSLVGPRPEDPAYVAHWPEDTHRLLLSVRPGMTSPASIVYRDEEQMLAADNVEEAYLSKILPDKLQLDLRYVQRRSILGDMDVLFWTAVVLIPLLRRRQIPTEHLLWGPVANFMSRYFSWFVVDVLVVFAVVAMTGLIWRSMGPLDVGLGIALLLALLVTLVFSLTNYLLGLSRIYWSNAKVGYVLVLFGSALVATIGLLLVNQQLPTPLPATMLMIVGLMAWLGFVVVRYRLRLVSGAAQHWLNLRPATSLMGERALIVGSGIVGRWAASLVAESELLPDYRVVGWVDDNVRHRDAQIGGYRVLGSTADIPAVVRKFDIGTIVFAIAECEEADRQRILGYCNQTPARTIFMPHIVDSIKDVFSGTGDKALPAGYPGELGQVLNQVDRLLEQNRVAEAQETIKALRVERVERDRSISS